MLIMPFLSALITADLWGEGSTVGIWSGWHLGGPAIQCSNTRGCGIPGCTTHQLAMLNQQGNKGELPAKVRCRRLYIVCVHIRLLCGTYSFVLDWSCKNEDGWKRLVTLKFAFVSEAHCVYVDGTDKEIGWTLELSVQVCIWLLKQPSP